MQSALAKGLGVSEDAITIDMEAKTASADLGGAELDMSAVEAAMEATNKFSATLIN